MPTFPDKLRRLMRTHGETTRSLGKAVKVTSAAVTGWTKGAAPRPDVAKSLAAYFSLSYDDLFDDARDLPPSPQEYLNEAPIRKAGELTAMLAAGPLNERQKAFEQYLAFLQSVRATAEAMAPNDPVEARRHFDHALATWLATAGLSPADIAASAALAKLKTDAGHILYPTETGRSRRG